MTKPNKMWKFSQNKQQTHLNLVQDTIKPQSNATEQINPIKQPRMLTMEEFIQSRIEEGDDPSQAQAEWEIVERNRMKK